MYMWRGSQHHAIGVAEVECSCRLDSRFVRERSKTVTENCTRQKRTVVWLLYSQDCMYSKHCQVSAVSLLRRWAHSLSFRQHP